MVCLLAFLAPLSFGARELVIRHCDEQVVISPDGTIAVTETIEAEFIGSNWHGIYRTIPVEYVTPQGLITSSTKYVTRFSELRTARDARESSFSRAWAELV